MLMPAVPTPKIFTVTEDFESSIGLVVKNFEAYRAIDGTRRHVKRPSQQGTKQRLQKECCQGTVHTVD
jgi:hypothetical protein